MSSSTPGPAGSSTHTIVNEVDEVEAEETEELCQQRENAGSRMTADPKCSFKSSLKVEVINFGK